MHTWDFQVVFDINSSWRMVSPHTIFIQVPVAWDFYLLLVAAWSVLGGLLMTQQVITQQWIIFAATTLPITPTHITEINRRAGDEHTGT